jgi:hypothetical protein
VYVFPKLSILLLLPLLLQFDELGQSINDFLRMPLPYEALQCL